MKVTPFPLSPSYGVTEAGNIIRLDTGAMLRPAPRSKAGYLSVSLWENGEGKTWFVHQIVALTFHGPRPSPQHHAAHDDGDKWNNCKSNVFWKTKVENERDKVRHGTSNHGDRNGMSKARQALRASQ
jgi:HNH endonuclease